MSSSKRCLYFLGSFQKSLFKVFFLMHNTCRMVQKHWATNDVHILIVTCDKTPYKNILDLCPNHQKILSRLFQLIFCIFFSHKDNNTRKYKPLRPPDWGLMYRYTWSEGILLRLPCTISYNQQQILFIKAYSFVIFWVKKTIYKNELVKIKLGVKVGKMLSLLLLGSLFSFYVNLIFIFM